MTIYRESVGGEDATTYAALERRDVIRFGSFGPIVETIDGCGWRMATQEDLDSLPVGEDLTPEEEAEVPD